MGCLKIVIVACLLSAAPAFAGGNARFSENGQVFTAKVTGVTLCDVNGNGHLDAVFGVTSPGTNHIWVMTNDGHGVFTKSQSEGADYILNAATADVDCDGDLDLFLAHFAQPATLWLNDGDGIFARSNRALPLAGVIVPADFNGDGFCDVAVSDSFGDASVVVCLNDAQGVFTNTQSHAVLSFSVAAGDMNGDGHTDIVSAGPANDTVLLNDGTGNFGIGWSGGSAWHETDSIALGDVNGDGRLDQVASGFFGPGTWYGLRIMTNDGSGLLTVSQITGPSHSCRGVALGDLNGDGALDVVLAGDSSANINTTIWTNDGTGFFSPTGQQFGHLGNEWGTDISLGDLDGDNALDLALGDEASVSRPFWMNNAPEMEVLGTNSAPIGDPTMLVFEPPNDDKGTRMGAFPTGIADFTNRLTITNSGPGFLRLKQPTIDRPDASWFRVGSIPPTLPPGGTANLDIIFAPGLTGWDTLTARVSFVNGGWHPGIHGYETNMEIWISAKGNPPLSSNVHPNAPGFDIAGGAEVSIRFGEEPAGSTVDPGTLLVYGSRGGVWRGAVSYDAGGRVASLYPSSDYRPGEFITAELLLAVSNAAGTTRFRPYAWSFHARASDGDGHFAPASEPVLSNHTMVTGAALGDLNGDGMLDALVGTLEPRRLAIAINDGIGRLIERGAIFGPPEFQSIRPPTTLSDLDGDGDIDIVACVGWQETNGLAVWKNDGTGNFSNAFLNVQETVPASHLRTADVDGDGHIDVVMTSYWDESGFPPIWLNDGTGRFSPLTHNSSGPMIFPASYWGCEIGDVNGDGAVDLVFGSSPESTPCHISVWFNDGRGRFTDSGQHLDTNTSWSVHLGDLNGNGRLDIFAVRTRSDYITDACIWTNDGSGFFSLAGEVRLPTGSGQYHGQGLADLDGDGDLDAIAGGWEYTANKILLNDGTGCFSVSDTEIGFGAYTYSKMGDLNGDGAVDLLMSRVNVDPELQVWLNRTRPKAGFGKALSFDGVDDYLLMSDVRISQFSGSNDFTIAMWVRPSTNGTLYRLFSLSADEQLRTALSLDSTGHVTFAMAKGAFSGGSRATSTNPIPWRRWSHIAAVKDGNALRIHLNGSLAGTGVVHPTVLAAPATTGDTYIAATALPVGDHFHGDLDEIQIWNTALSAAQISDWMYRAPDRSHPCITSLVAHFDCNEGAALRITSRDGPPIQAGFSSGMDEGAWVDSDVRDWRTWVNQPMEGSLIGSHSDGSSNLSFEILQQSAFGTVEVTFANAFQFTPPANQVGTNAFTFQVITTNGMTSTVANACIVVPPDYDEDGMEDLWELLWGLLPDDPADAHEHLDDDGADNLSEFIAGTDPMSSASHLRISEMEQRGVEMELRWDTVVGRRYGLEGSSNLSAGWFDIVADLPTSGVWTGAIGGAEPMLHYRLRVRRE